MSKAENYYNEPPMALTLTGVKKYASNKNKFCCKDMPLLDIPLSNIVLDELHLLRVTDILLSNLIEDAMELDKKDFLSKRHSHQIMEGIVYHVHNLSHVYIKPGLHCQSFSHHSRNFAWVNSKL